jgi:hypothetical protein
MAGIETLPLTLGSLDIVTEGLPIDTDPQAELIHLSHGFSSDAYRVGIEGSHVVKISKKHGHHQAISRSLGRLEEEHDINEHYLEEEGVPPTEFIVAQLKTEQERLRLVTVQEFIEGEVVSTHLTRKAPNIAALIKFYKKALRMYEETGKIPDLANIQEGFRPSVNTNVIVTEKAPGVFVPVLTDTNFGRVQRTFGIGGLLSIGIAVGVEKIISRLENQQL